MPVITTQGMRTTCIVLDQEEWSTVEGIRTERRHRHRAQTIRELLDLGIKAYRAQQRVLQALAGGLPTS